MVLGTLFNFNSSLLKGNKIFLSRLITCLQAIIISQLGIVPKMSKWQSLLEAGNPTQQGVFVTLGVFPLVSFRVLPFNHQYVFIEGSTIIHYCPNYHSGLLVSTTVLSVTPRFFSLIKFCWAVICCYNFWSTQIFKLVDLAGPEPWFSNVVDKARRKLSFPAKQQTAPRISSAGRNKTGTIPPSRTSNVPLMKVAAAKDSGMK